MRPRCDSNDDGSTRQWGKTAHLISGLSRRESHRRRLRISTNEIGPSEEVAAQMIDAGLHR